MHRVLRPDATAVGGYVQVAYNDDAGDGTLRSKVVFTPTLSETYVVWIRGWNDSNGGFTDVFVNDTRRLTQAPFGGTQKVYAWAAGDRFDVVGRRPPSSCTPACIGYPRNDYMLFLTAYGRYSSMNDDSGANYYPSLTPGFSGHSFTAIHVGTYPGYDSEIANLMKDDALGTVLDSDGDSLSDAFELLAGSDRFSSDGDNDGLLDQVEIRADGIIEYYTEFSPTEYGNAYVPDVYVELDWMVHPFGYLQQPYTALENDARAIFQTDSPNGIKLWVFRSGVVPFSEWVNLDDCGTAPGCATLTSIKQAKQSYPFPFFHYGLWAYQNTASSSSSGFAEIGGNDFIVSLGDRQLSAPTQLGTFMHELGHNLLLTHNGNDNPQNNYNSLIHGSVMNYRYTFGGVPQPGGNPNRHTYSFGTGSTTCAQSSKWACRQCLFNSLCTGSGCSTCDVDVNEWGAAMDLTTLWTGEWSDGSSGGALGSGAKSEERSARQEASAPSLRASSVPMRAPLRGADRARYLNSRGLVEGRDFHMTASGRSVVACP